MSDGLDNAAAAALVMLGLTQLPNQEHMGALFRSQGGYDRSQTVTSGQSAHVKGTISIPAGSLAGLFHNHPGPDKSSEGFSLDDIAKARRSGVPSYISTPSGKWLRYDPRTNTTEEILAEYPINDVLKHIEGRNPFAKAAAAARMQSSNPMTAALRK